MSLAFADALINLDTILGDGNDVTFTSSEKSRAMTRAWQDSYVVNSVWDTSLSYTQGTYQYSFPGTLSTIKDIYISATGSSNPMPEPIDASLWEAVNGKIQFRARTDNIIPTGNVLYLKGNYKLTVSDSITPPVLQEYVLALAGYYTLTLLGHKKVNLFLKNDTTLNELVTFRRELDRDVIELRRRLARDWESA